MSKILNIGDKSGCLEVIGGFTESEYDLQETFYQWAENEWNRNLYSSPSNIDVPRCEELC